MKKFAILAALAATPAMAHPGHPVAPGAFGHDFAHLALAAAGIVAAAIAVEGLRRFAVARRRGR